METMLLIVTLLSLSVAVGTSAFAWRLMRNERLRSEARIAALAADVEPDTASHHADAAPTLKGSAYQPGEREFATPTLRRSAYEPEFAVQPLRASADEPREPEFAVPALKRSTTESGARAGAEFAVEEKPTAIRDELLTVTETRPGRSVGRIAAVVGAGAVAVATLVGVLIVSSGREDARAATAHPAADASSAPKTLATEAPVELVALAHEREPDRLTVRGLVRSPSATIANHLTAVVQVFDRDGEFLASGRAEVEHSAAPGADRRFIVSIPGGAGAGRYRVSFTDDQRVVPHVDKRTPAI